MAWTLAASGRESVTAAPNCTTAVASPGVVAGLVHTAAAGDIVRFATTGALPTGLVAGTAYYVISAGLTASAFEVSATSGGAAINFTGTTSGQSSVTFEHVMATVSTNATFYAEVDLNNMTLGDIIELRAYDILLSGQALGQLWKGSYQNPQISPHKAFPFMPSDQQLMLTVRSLQGLTSAGTQTGATFTGTATFTNGSANITFTTNPFLVDDTVNFTTSGTLPTNFAINTVYYVVTSSGTTITVSATRGGAAISAGSAGTGTQTANRIGHTFPWKLLSQ